MTAQRLGPNGLPLDIDGGADEFSADSIAASDGPVALDPGLDGAPGDLYDDFAAGGPVGFDGGTDGRAEQMLQAGELAGAHSVGGASGVDLPRGHLAEHTGPLPAAALDDGRGIAREIEADTSVRLLSRDVNQPTDPGYLRGNEETTIPVGDDDEEVVAAPRKLTRAEQRAIDTKNRLTSPWASAIAIALAIIWTIPSIGLLVTSFRDPVDIRRSGWWNVFSDLFGGQSGLTLDNYQQALFGSADLYSFFINSFVITLPAVVIPITIALLAAYAFAWVDFRGRDILFVAVFALQVVPLQVALVPLMRDYVGFGIGGSFWAVWFSHSIFALPLAIFLLHNFMKEIPASLIEAARVDGAGHVKIFFQVLLPLLVPAIASFGIFQFLWVWNDLLVGLTFANPAFRPLTVAVAELAGSRGGQWHLLTAGAFISMIVPLIVFLALQRYFVRGLLAGSVKG